MAEPITASEAAVFLRLDGATDSPTPEETFLGALIEASRQAAENFLNRTITERTRILELDNFVVRDSGLISQIIPLPFGIVSSVETIAYIDSAGDPQTVSEFILSENRLSPAFGETWPDTQVQIGAVTITYTAGYTPTGSPAVDVTPKAIVQAMFLMIGDMYENREAVAQGSVYQINPTVMNLLQPYRLDMGV